MTGAIGARCTCSAMATPDYDVEPEPGCPVHGDRPPGEPVAQRVAEQLADVVVVDGPHRGEVWVYEAAHGGYLPHDPVLRQDNDIPLVDIGALLEHCHAEVVRPLPRRSS